MQAEKAFSVSFNVLFLFSLIYHIQLLEMKYQCENWEMEQRNYENNDLFHSISITRAFEMVWKQVFHKLLLVRKITPFPKIYKFRFAKLFSFLFT